MARKERHHIGVMDALTPAGLVPKHLTKQQFAQRLHRLRLAKGWNQSDLARAADLPRDSISVYLRAKSLPTALSLQKLSQALGVPPEELLPNHAEQAIAEDDTPSFELRVSTGAPSRAWIRVNRLVSLTTAVKIADLLEHDNADGSRGGGAAAV